MGDTYGNYSHPCGSNRRICATAKILKYNLESRSSKTKSGIWSFLRSRIFSFGLIISIGFLLLISLVFSSVLSASGSWVTQQWSVSLLILFQILNIIFSLAIITVLFALMFKFLPDAKIKWRFVWIGAFFTSLLFVLGKTALGIYFGTAQPGSGYGAAGSHTYSVMDFLFLDDYILWCRIYKSVR